MAVPVPPLPPPTGLARTNGDGTPTQAQIDYERKLSAWVQAYTSSLITGIPFPSPTTLGGVLSATASTHQFQRGIDTGGNPLFAQPAAGDISGLGSLATLNTVAVGSVTGLGALATLDSVSLSSAQVTGNLPISKLNSGIDASSSKFWRGDGTWASVTASPGGTSGQIQFNSAGSFAGFTVSGDGTLDPVLGSLIVTKTNGVAFATVATSGSASDLGTGTLPAGRLPNPSATTLGGVQSKAAVASNWLTSISTSGVPAASQPAVTDVTGAAPLASPTFTGTPAAPTAAVDTNTTQIASTAFVLAQAASATPLIDGTAAVGTSTRYARGDHIHPTDTTRAKSGANSDITSITNLSTPLSVAQGGSGTNVATGAGNLVLSTSPTLSGPFITNGLNLRGATSGQVTLAAAAVAGTNTVTFPAGTTDFSATGGTSQVVKQTSSGGAFTVAQLAVADVTGAAPLASPTFTGTVTIPAGASISGFAKSGANSDITSLTSGNIGIGNTAPGTRLTVSANATTGLTPPTGGSGTIIQGLSADSTAARLELFSFGGSTSLGGYRSGGTSGALTATASGVNLCGLQGGGYDGSAWKGATGSITLQSSELFSGTANGTRIVFGVVKNTTVTSLTQATLENTGAFTACQASAIPAGGTVGLGFMLSSTANFGIFFGSGAPTLSAAQGSLYLRSDGSSTSTRMYVNTNGSTGWTNVTTAT